MGLSKVHFPGVVEAGQPVSERALFIECLGDCTGWEGKAAGAAACSRMEDAPKGQNSLGKEAMPGASLRVELSLEDPSPRRPLL